MNRNNFHDTVDQIISYGIEKEILHLFTSRQPFHGAEIVINNNSTVNFGSCSYLGLEFHPALKKGALQAIERYGTQFSASRAYISLGLYKELESLLQKIFEAPAVITPTTTLGHIACIPVVVQDDAAVIMDHQVHNSVQTAVQLVKARGVHTELVRHNRTDLLEEKIKELRNKYRTIWYMADGIYSMFGDCCPVDTIYNLLDKYPELHFYVDDAHGMGIHGKHGRGFVLTNRNVHPKMIMATSLNKAFASGGGVLVFGNPALAAKVGHTGSTLLSSGPMQPGSLGAAIAAANIFLSPDITVMQQELKDAVHFTRLLLAKYKLPVVSEPGAAIFFIPVSLPKLGHRIVKQMLEAGYYVNLGIFPTVPMKQTGIRFTVTRLHSFEQIEKMIATLAAVLPAAMKEEQISLYEIYKAFKIPVPGEVKAVPTISDLLRQAVTLETRHSNSITGIDKADWDALFKGKGSFDWEGLQLLENAFSNNTLPEDNWQFDYLIVRDEKGNIVAATFFTTALWKDDMLSPAGVSVQLENTRKNNPYYLTSKAVCCGSLFTEGEHLYIDMQSPLWKDAMQAVFETAYSLQEKYKAGQIVIRDFHSLVPALDNLMVDNGFFRVQLPDTYRITQLSRGEGFLERLSYNSKRQLQKKILKHTNDFDISIYQGNAPQAAIEYWYRLYLNVKNNNPALNTFALPVSLFHHIGSHPDWEMIVLTLNAPGTDHTRPCCVIFCHTAGDSYIPMVIGIDYRYNKEYNVYRQALYRVITRAQQLGKKSVLLGFSAGTEKQKLGAVPAHTYAYIHSTDSYNAQAVASLSMLVQPKHRTAAQ